MCVDNQKAPVHRQIKAVIRRAGFFQSGLFFHTIGRFGSFSDLRAKTALIIHLTIQSPHPFNPQGVRSFTFHPEL